METLPLIAGKKTEITFLLYSLQGIRFLPTGWLDLPRFTKSTLRVAAFFRFLLREQ
jgi:hypothetical protein